ncbi:sugar phosphate isomerase/epimerase [Streptomyces sp. NPDC019396]|uniref:sugar phosphate isomerase/epimerase family protein n=1 Tax=Streptomyces sp. NPDC019396 TaxID=3154687 RepID=UPI0033F72969
MDKGLIMQLGMFTACLPKWPLNRIATWAAEAGYDALEIACWPRTGGRDFEASHLPVADFGPAEQEETLLLQSRHGLTFSALSYYENNLHPDPERRREIHAHLRHTIDAAYALKVPCVGTFIGRDPGKSVARNLSDAEVIFPALVDYAGERGVKLVIENCVMEGWHPDGYPGNLAYSPELWEWMFGLGLYLNWDPSHLTWIGIDPVPTIARYADRIAHAQAKDVEVDSSTRQRYGFFGKTMKGDNPWDMGWWRYRVPGLGQVDWAKVVDRLYEHGFTGALCVEHEDPIWTGNPQQTTQGLRIAHRTLRPLMVH